MGREEKKGALRKCNVTRAEKTLQTEHVIRVVVYLCLAENKFMMMIFSYRVVLSVQLNTTFGF
jgi:hypothetical protein